MTERDDATIEQPRPRGPHEAGTVPPSGSAALVVSILDRYLAELQAGQAPDRDELLAGHPELAAQLEACLAGIEFVHRATGPAAVEPATLGEFRIVRELGRGGMGVVYEAEQTSLRRRVALKVLRFGVGVDEEAMQRFRREAETVAGLHHTNIVPIFAIGSGRGVHYYAMQLIAGRSLADVLEESQHNVKPLDVEDVARWGLQAAEALAHAHQRGVIHRDIKPSNLLLDQEGIVWLTDFGLAKRAGEVTMTASGALMGTPRYMSPEQAESLQRTVDHRTDIYSLGASLYELATGRPVFASPTPHGVVVQILTEEPVRPRQVRPDLPRDLETIISTCLAKDPAERYQTAQALADDLRAVLDGRPIQARRAPLGERVVRHVRKHKKALGRGVLVVVVTAVFIVGPILGWQLYSEWQLGRVVLTTDGPPLTAQVLAESGDERIGEPFAVGTKTLESLPAAEYRLQVEGTGVLSQAYRLGVDRGDVRTYRISLDEHRLLGQDPIPYAFASSAMVLSPGKADLVEWTGRTLLRRDGVSGTPIWDASQPRQAWESRRDPVAWMNRLSYLGDTLRPGSLVQPAPDVDGDGTADIVWAFRGTPSLLALSGQDGSMLWTFTADVDGRGEPDAHGPEWPRSLEQVPRPGRVLGSPSLADVDGDGALDFLVAFAQFEDGPPVLRLPGANARSMPQESAHRGRRGVVAVSGRSGRALWTHPIDPEPTTLPIDPFDRGATLVWSRGDAIVALLDGARWLGLSAASGQPRGKPIDLGFVPVRPVQYADLDGDGAPEVLALETAKGSQSQMRSSEEGGAYHVRAFGMAKGSRSQVVAAFSLATGEPLWQEPVSIPYDDPYPLLKMEWPLAADVDGDGRAEVVIPTTGPLASRYDFQGVRLLDGATGQTRWVRRLRPHNDAYDGLAHLITGPDLDQDGTSDVVAVSRYDGRHPRTFTVGNVVEPQRIYVDAISGKDGHPLWWWYRDVENSFGLPSLLIWPPSWWGPGADGWPMLVVPLGGAQATAYDQAHPGAHPEPASVHLLSATDGRELHAIHGLSWPRVADLDGDGLDDLWGSVDGKLRAYRGATPEVWRVLGPYHTVGDLDGDGIGDVVINDLRIRTNIHEPLRQTLSAVARSGRDGRVLWRSRLDDYASTAFELDDRSEAGYRLSAFPLPGGDLDGDGTVDVLVTKHLAHDTFAPQAASLPLQALSGRSGQPLWSAGPLPLGFEATGYTRIQRMELRTCEPDGPADLIAWHRSTFAPPGSFAPGIIHEQTRLTRVSGRDGAVIWDTLLVERKGKAIANVPGLPWEFGDFDGDGALDVLMLLQVDGSSALAFERRAVSLRDGKTLWSHAAPFHADRDPAFAVGDLDGDGRAEIVVRDQAGGNDAEIALSALDGRDGRARWTWRSGALPAAADPRPRDFCLADFGGKGQFDVCLLLPTADGRQRLVILDAHGTERAARDLKAGPARTLTRADLKGDRRDALLFLDDNQLRAVGQNLQDLWSWPTRESIREVIRAQAGQPSTVVLDSMVSLDGTTGRPRWAGHGAAEVLDPGDATRPPRLLSESGGVTICRTALYTTPDGSFQPARGTPIKHSLAPDDPRWIRTLPWSKASIAFWLGPLCVLGALALINLVIPVAILRMATRRRARAMRLLLALPVAVAIPIAMLIMVKSMLREAYMASWSDTTLALAGASFAGLPVLKYTDLVGQSLFRRRWTRCAWLAGLTVLASAALGACWLGFEMRRMPAIERYHWSGWSMVLLPGAYSVGVVAVIASAARGAARLVSGLGRRLLAAGRPRPAS
jgi:hypothetical protein